MKAKQCCLEPQANAENISISESEAGLKVLKAKGKTVMIIAVDGSAAGAMAISSLTVVSNSALLKLAKFKSSKVNQ